MKSFDVKTRTMSLVNGEFVKDIDGIIFCTGYQGNYRFIKKGNKELYPDDPSELFQHIFPINKESGRIAFVGIPKMAAAFTVAEAQSALIARVWSTRVSLPEVPSMKLAEKHAIKKWKLWMSKQMISLPYGTLPN